MTSKTIQNTPPTSASHPQLSSITLPLLAAIKALAEEHKTLEAIVQSVLTGRPEHLPSGYRSDSSTPITDEEGELLENLGSALGEVMSLTQVEPGPVPIKEFCSRPENMNLKGLCK
jgi:hypothetical protein